MRFYATCILLSPAPSCLLPPFPHASQPPSTVPDVHAGMKVLRFSYWQRIWGDTRNAQMLPRSWDQRSTLSTHSYLRKDGVSVEHMLALANKVQYCSPPYSRQGWEELFGIEDEQQHTHWLLITPYALL